MKVFSFSPQAENLFGGTRERHRRLPDGLSVILIGDEIETAKGIAARVVGESVASGGFNFSGFVDPVGEWIQDAHPQFSDVSFKDIQAILDLPVRLGSISLQGCALSYVKDELTAFWIETFEGEKTRVLSSSHLSEGGFSGLDPRFSITADWLASAVIGQY